MVYDMLTQFGKTLGNLSAILDVANQYSEAKKLDPSVLLNSRLIADQFNLIRQVQIACDSAKLAAARLAGKEAPVHEDKEQTVAELKTRIESVQAYLKTFKADDFKGFEERKITQPRWEGKWLTGSDYLHQHAVPNVYFHVTTAYAILRANGVDIGKKNYLGEMPYKK